MFVKEKPDRKKMSYVWHFYSLDFSATEEDSDEQKETTAKIYFCKKKKSAYNSLLKELHLRDTESHFR